MRRSLHNMTRTITITPILNGFICKVDCQQVAFSSVESLLGALKAYYEAPELTEKLFIEQAINKMPTGPQLARAPFPEAVFPEAVYDSPAQEASAPRRIQ